MIRTSLIYFSLEYFTDILYNYKYRSQSNIDYLDLVLETALYQSIDTLWA